ncbi:dihydrolipoamide dehydrogenase [Rhodococcus rhodochrous J3]|uniref:Dihydrolipoyl dehydrogenase n=1 Tax=Rhodococcus rhodochrous J3 TaxID=903528 RepID=A0ABY1MIC2_RHORH|nr:dihydrolipoyl dehydrogenase [Rhodococcus rhodochrous]MBF4477829.1 dihydrolipoyl dehydrogenase [Rhodococcus rhodochrous]MCB8913763.1 dihydrolipoyl dehydrogenase [Rhodococcus rhodochrous]MCD2100374.1 dihydrolipoyl dehydrogenase [Rhodococcus rhodochrous]MCD2124809.1 dihydrolipoyl dehydrogenase [Rhodococcus rhodochrous]MCQ4138045.1 dihydrolipoyl dehydrogenase [Rhodococcus rhodochrous]
MTQKYDVLVVGSGPGGYVAAIRAAQHGLRTAIVERDRLGGICLNWGCIPTKALLHGADVAHTLVNLQPLGFSTGSVEFDMGRLVEFSRSVSGRLSDGIGYLMKKNDIDVVEGVARLLDKGVVAVTTADETVSEYRADHVILATGARPRPVPGVIPDGDRIWTYFDALVPTDLPKSLLVIGSGAVGVEFASLYKDLGTDVTLVEMAPQIMPVEDFAVASHVRRQFEQRGIKIHTGASVSELAAGPDTVTVTVQSTAGTVDELTVDRVLVAAGIQGNVEDLGLTELGIEVEHGFITTDQWCRTSAFGVYAIGDVAGAPCLAHKASHEAVLCVDKLAGVQHVRPLDRDYVPGCTYARPQVASLGLTEEQARATGRRLQVGQFDLQASGKALAIGEADGFVKTIFDADSGELLGAHMVGPDVTEQIQGFGIARALEATADDLAEVVFAHPTLSEAMHESVLSALGRPINM